MALSAPLNGRIVLRALNRLKTLFSSFQQLNGTGGALQRPCKRHSTVQNRLTFGPPSFMYEKTNKTVVDVRQFPLIRQVVSYFLTAMLLSLPLASFTVDSAFTSYDDAASTEVSLKTNNVGNTENCPLRSGFELSFNGELIPAERLTLPGDRLQSSAQPALAVLSLKDLSSEIFIPPRSIS